MSKLQKKANQKAAQAVAKAAEDGKIKGSELRKAVALYGQAAVANAMAPLAAGNSGLVIGGGARDLTGVKAKDGIVTYTPRSWQANDITSGTIKTRTADVSGLSPQFVSNASGGYTYLGPAGSLQMGAPGGAGAGAGAPSASQPWSDSIDAGTQAMLASLNATLDQNKANQALYMGMIDSLVGQMNAANKQVFSGPYAVNSQNSAPVQGAQITQAIARRLKNFNTSLAIAPAEATTAGTGLNIAA
jgi:hypothetical protein